MQIKNKIFCFFIFFIFTFNALAEEFNITASEILFDKKNKVLIGKGYVKAVDSEGKIINCDLYDIQQGNTKVFIKKHIYDKLEKDRLLLLNNSSILLQSHIRTIIARNNFLKIRNAILKIQCFQRCLISIKIFYLLVFYN